MAHAPRPQPRFLGQLVVGNPETPQVDTYEYEGKAYAVSYIWNGRMQRPRHLEVRRIIGSDVLMAELTLWAQTPAGRLVRHLGLVR